MDMKKLLNTAAALSACLTIFSGCVKDDVVSTNQFDSDAISLNVYGPQPVMRGGELRFLGSNLDQIVEVRIPGVDPITEINVVKKGVPSEIRVIVPKDGPEPGLVTLVAKCGKEIVTKTGLTYSEPVVLESVSPLSVKPGDVITLKGDYFNLMHEVVFAEEVKVSEEEFLTHTRYEITVKVPETARTGKLGLGDIDEIKAEDNSVMANVVYFDDELTVAAPVISRISAARWKAGDLVTVSGSNLNLVQKVNLPGAENVEHTIAANGNSLTFTLPATAQDGVITLVAKSGVEIVSEAYKTVIPTALSVAGLPVKAGGEITISGKDLDLVTVVSLANAGEAEFAYANDAITLTVSDTAQEGDITLGLENGTSVTTALTLVKPVIAAYSANPAPAGSELTITGTDLDLVKSVTFGGNLTVEVTAEETALTVGVPTTAETGELAFNLANGTSVKGESLTVEKPSACYITELPAEGTEILGGTVLIVPVENEDKLDKVLVNGEEVKILLNGKSLYISLPDMAAKGTVITLVSSNGTVEYTIDVTPNNIQKKVIWSGEFTNSGWSGNQDLAWGGFDWTTVDLSAGTVTLVFDITRKDPGAWACLALRTGTSWGEFSTPIQIEIPEGATTVEIPFTQAMLDEILDDNGLILTGDNYTLTKITMVTVLPTETTIWEGNIKLSWSVGGRVCLPASAFEKLSAGSLIHFYYDQIDQTWAQAQINNGAWAGIEFPEIGGATLIPTDIYGWEFASRCTTFTLTQEILDNILANRKNCDEEGTLDNGIIIQGQDLIFTKVTVE